MSASGTDILIGTSGNNKLNGGSGDDMLFGMAGNDTLTGGSGNDLLDGGAGSDRVSGDSGNDALIYTAAENTGQTDIYDGGSGADVLVLKLTGAEWSNAAVRADVAAYLAFIARNTLPNGQANNAEFRFSAFDLRVSKIEQLLVIVDGSIVDPTAPPDRPVTAQTDAIATTEDAASAPINLLANDSAPDGVQSVVITSGPTQGTVQLTIDLTTPSSPKAFATYLPGVGLQSLAQGESVTDTFTYRVTDADGDIGTATVAVTITGSNDAPVVSAAVSRSGAEGSGTASVDLLQNAGDVDHGAVLHVENLVWDEVPAGFPAGFVLSGNTIAVDTDSPAYNGMAAGATFTTHFTYDVVDEHGARVQQHATITITGTNDGPTVSAAVSGAGDEGSGTFSVDLLQNASDVDAGAVLHVENLVWDEVPAGFPAGFTFSGSSIAVDTDSLAYDGMAAGATFTTHFTYDVVDEHGARVQQHATITITGTNDGPQATADVNGADAVVDPGTGAGNAPIPGDPSASGNVLANDSDVDSGDALSVSAVNGVAALVGLPVLGTYGLLVLDANGDWTYNVETADGDTNHLAAGDTATDVFSYTVQDGSGATTTATLTITVTGTNDAPDILSGIIGGTVKEDIPNNVVNGRLNAFDPDRDAQLSWTVVGGTPSGQADYHFTADRFTITKNMGSLVILQDDFSDGLPPPDSPPLNPNGTPPTPTSYAGVGTLTESDGRLHFDSDGAVLLVGPGTNDPIIGQNAIVRTNVDSNPTGPGLKVGEGFAIRAVFDLTMPNSPREAYGIRISDRLLNPVLNADGSTTPAQIGDDTFELVVRQNPAGVNVISLRELDFVNDVTTNLQNILLNPPPGADQIQLALLHTPGSPVLTAAFQYMQGGVLIGTQQNFAATAPAFAADAIDTQVWTRAEIVAYAPQFTDSLLGGSYGTLSIGQSGAWTYSLNNNLISTQSLSEGQHVNDVFVVQVTDEHGAFDTQTITIDVVGSNDAPVIQPPPAPLPVFHEDAATTFTTSAIVNFSDQDLQDSHTVTASFVGVTTSSGSPIPSWSMPALQSALTASQFDVATGDGHGQYNWTFTLSNSDVQFLGAHDVLNLIYRTTVTDSSPYAGSHASASQNLFIAVFGANDDAVITAATPGSDTGAVTEDLDIVADQLTVDGSLSFTDVDLGDVHSVLVSTTSPGALGSLTAVKTADTTNSSAPGFIAWTYTVDNASVQDLAEGETRTETFTIALNDGTSVVTKDVTVTITGTNDAPAITGGSTTGTVKEDVTATASGHLTVFDPDHNAQLLWEVGGGTTSADADYRFTADRFTINRNLIPVFNDTFDDGVPPPSPPPGATFGNGYTGVGSFSESDGRLVFADENAGAFVGAGTPDPFIGQNAVLRSNIDPASPNGLKSTADFSVVGVFDLVVPDSPREFYGIRLMDRLVGGPGNPPDQQGDDSIEIAVRKTASGAVVVGLREVDFVNDSSTPIASVALAPPPGADQIRLVLTHLTSDVGAVQASFQYLQAGAIVGGHSFTQVGRIFGTETPGFTGDDEVWTRAEIIAGAPAKSDSLLSGTFGTLTITQAGDWTYSLDSGRNATQNLAEGEHATDTFTVTVTDEHGAQDTETITIDVVGSNDAPIMHTQAVTRTLSEDVIAGQLTATGLAQFSDVDLTDTHTMSASLQSAVRSGGGALPAGLQAQLEDAVEVFLVNAATGDGQGSLQWNFALDNGAVQFLAAGESLVLHYNVTAADPSNAAAVQDVAITITGHNDAPVITLHAGSSAANPIMVAENTVGSFLTVTADDAEDQLLSFTIGANPDGSYDNAFFSIDAATGALQFTAPPDFEFTDPGNDDLYKVQVTVSDTQGGTTHHDYFVQVTDVPNI